MTVDDAKKVNNLENICFADPWTVDGIVSMLVKDCSYFFVAECDGVFAGYSEMYIVLDEGNVCNIAVQPDYRKLGIGQKLVEALINAGKELNLSVMMLEVRKGNEKAIRLYEKCGFEHVGTRKNYYDHPIEDGLMYNYYYRKN